MAVASAAGAAAPQTTAAVPPERLIDLICKLIETKPSWRVEIEKRVAAGSGLNVKGIEVSTVLLKQVLAKSPAPSTSNSTPAGAPAARGTTADGARSSSFPTAPAVLPAGRWQPPATTTQALASKAIHECENAEPFCRSISVAPGTRIAVLSKPVLQSKPTGEYIQGGTTEEVVARCIVPREGRVYLRLKRHTGWVAVRSRKDFSKVVLSAGDSGGPLEPAECGASIASPAAQLLTLTDEDGKDLPSSNIDESASMFTLARREPQMFCAVGNRSQILPKPTAQSAGTSICGASLNKGEKFAANAVHVNAADGRAYLRLLDGRGWVSERLRTNFAKFEVKPCDGSWDGLDLAEVKAQDYKKVLTAASVASKNIKIVAESWLLELPSHRDTTLTRDRVTDLMNKTAKFSDHLLKLVQSPIDGVPKTKVCQQAADGLSGLVALRESCKNEVDVALGRATPVQRQEIKRRRLDEGGAISAAGA